MKTTVGMLRDLIDGFAPFDTAESYDNVGLLVGRADRAADTVLVAMDATEGVIAEAKSIGAQLLVTHHPLLFSPRRDLREEDREGRLLAELARADLSLIAAHTNFDKAPGGINDALLAALGFPGEGGEGITRTVALPEPLPLQALAARVQAALGDVVRCFGVPGWEEPVRRLTVCGGAGSDYWEEALPAGADCFLTGECKLHHALAATQAGVHALSAGHFATEWPGVTALHKTLQSAANAVQYPVRVVLSSCAPFA